MNELKYEGVPKILKVVELIGLKFELKLRCFSFYQNNDATMSTFKKFVQFVQ